MALGLDHSIYVYSCEDGELMEAMEHVYQSKGTCIENATCMCWGIVSVRSPLIVVCLCVKYEKSAKVTDTHLLGEMDANESSELRLS